MTPGSVVQAAYRAGSLLARAAAIAAMALSLLVGTALEAAQTPAAPPDDASGGEAKSTLQTITIEAPRQLERQVSHFVASIVVHYQQDSLVRWDTKICPLVAGLSREQGEFMLVRISQIARDVGAPLDGAHCRANFYVVVTPKPDELVKKCLSRNPFSRRNGMGYINSFLTTPVRRA